MSEDKANYYGNIVFLYAVNIEEDSPTAMNNEQNFTNGKNIVMKVNNDTDIYCISVIEFLRIEHNALQKPDSHFMG